MSILYKYFLMEPIYWIIPWILQSAAYYLILGKMGLKKRSAIIPFLAEKEFSSVLFRTMRTFWRPFIITAVFVIGAYYLGPMEGTGHLYMIIAFIVYGVFLLRLYHRIAKSFGKKFWYTILIWIFPLLFLGILGLGKSQYTPPELKPIKDLGPVGNWLRHGAVVLISAVEIVALVAGVGFITIRSYPPEILVNAISDDVYNKSKDIKSDGLALTREDTMGAAAAGLAEMERSREKFFPDHSADKSVVVMEYIIGSNLENQMGMASANIRMMKDATARGDALTFVLETGGSGRWFTEGMADNSYGRYTVKGGKVEAVEELADLKTMEDPAHLRDFIKWTKDNYPADRYMLVLWDHGGGVPYGFGVDDLSHREDSEDFEGIRISEIADAVKESGVKFDVIGFDACLMQDIEIANAFEPYADYFLASEETEGGYGWYYTDAFGMLAENPGLPSEDFGKAIISTYDQFNTILKDDEPDTQATLSFADLTLMKPAYERFDEFCVAADEAIRKDPADFADFGIAAMNSYKFSSSMQLDLIDFMDKLDDTDIDDSICPQSEKDEVVNALKAAVVYRNKNSAEGINGVSFALPYESINTYSDTSSELKRLNLSNQKSLFDDVFSIIAVQKKNNRELIDNNDNPMMESLSEFLSSYQDYTSEDWYVKGFEDYDPVADLVDIPLKDTGDGYQVELPEKTWGIIADCQTIVYQKTDDGMLRYIGTQHIGGDDENGHPMVDMYDVWVHMNGRLVCYESTSTRETEEGTVYTGDVKARLNGVDDIIIHIEWEPEVKGSDVPVTGKVTGYDLADDTFSFMKKGSERFETGDKIEFLFDYYDAEGKLVKTEPYGKAIRITKQNGLKAEDKPLEDCDIEFLGVLTDVYQRNIMTETLEAHIGD